MIIKTLPQHKAALLRLIEESGQFDPDGLAHVSASLDNHFQEPQHDIWLTAIEDEPVGVAYCAPEPMTDGTWNLLMLWTKEGFAGRGFGKALVSEVENELKNRQVRLLIVETSQLPDFQTARAFYERSGFTLQAEIPDFFEQGDNKLIYTKSLKTN